MQAEYDNYRKRARRNRLAVRHVAVANVLRELLPVLDAVERACAHEPMTPGLREISETLRVQAGALGPVAFGEVGDPFDPSRHEALAHRVDASRVRPTRTAIVRPGYRVGDHLPRPACVEVTGPWRGR
ncbi:nucleotide exchange factor GrpE [Streptomyces sp. NPDC002309]